MQAVIGVAPDTTSYSHLFPAHLYIKKRTAGQEIDHTEEVLGDVVNQEIADTNTATQGLLLFDHESKVQIGPETTASSYDRCPVDHFGTKVLTQLGW